MRAASFVTAMNLTLCSFIFVPVVSRMCSDIVLRWKEGWRDGRRGKGKKINRRETISYQRTFVRSFFSNHPTSEVMLFTSPPFFFACYLRPPLGDPAYRVYQQLWFRGCENASCVRRSRVRSVELFGVCHPCCWHFYSINSRPHARKIMGVPCSNYAQTRTTLDFASAEAFIIIRALVLFPSPIAELPPIDGFYSLCYFSRPNS